MNAVLLTGGSDGSEILSSTQLLNVDGTVKSCAPPNLPEPRMNHVTFVTKDNPPKLATCGGSTTPTGISQPFGFWHISFCAPPPNFSVFA